MREERRQFGFKFGWTDIKLGVDGEFTAATVACGAAPDRKRTESKLEEQEMAEEEAPATHRNRKLPGGFQIRSYGRGTDMDGL